MNMKKKIFISFANVKDSIDFAQDLTEKLQNEDDVGDVFNFKNKASLLAGVEWLNHIRKRIGDCDVFIAVVTKKYLESVMCCKEFIGAFYSNKHVISVMIDEVPDLEECIYNLKDEINRLQYIIFKAIAPGAYDRLLLAIRNGTGAQDEEGGSDSLTQVPDQPLEPQSSVLDQYKTSAVGVFDGSFANLENVLCGPNLKIFTGQLFTAGLIGFNAMTDKDFTTVYRLFITGINMCESVEKIQDKCKKFTESLKTIGGPAKTLGEAINDKLSKV